MIYKFLKVNFLEAGLYLLVFLLPLQTRWIFKTGVIQGNYWEYGTYSFYIIDIFLGLLVSIFLMNKFGKLRFLKSNVNWRFIWFFVSLLELFVFISILFATDFTLAFYGYLRFLASLSLFFLILQIKFDTIKLYWSLSLSGAVQSVVAMQQFAMQKISANKWLGMATQNSAQAGTSVVETELRRWLRAYGTLSHPNIIGGFLAIVLIINIVLYFKVWEKFNQSNDRQYRIYILFSLILIILNTVGLLLTFSRTAWLAFLIGLLLLIPWAVDRYHKWGAIMITKVIFIVIVTALATIMIFTEPFQTRWQASQRLEKLSLTQRKDYYQDARQIINKHWLTGVGVKNYGQAVFNEINGQRSSYEYEPVHNTLLLIWAEIGFGGVAVFVVMLIYLFAGSMNKKKYFSACLIFALTMLLIFDHWLWSMVFGLYFFWLVVGLSVRSDL